MCFTRLGVIMSKKTNENMRYFVSVIAGGIVLFVVLLSTVSSVRNSRQRVAYKVKKDLVGTWQKVDNEDLTIEFTLGGHAIISIVGGNNDTTSYYIERQTLSFNRRNPIRWTVEFLSESEMLLVTASKESLVVAGKWHLISRPSVSGGVATLSQLKSKLAAYQKSARHFASLLPELQKSKKQLVDRLRELDVRLASDLKNKPEARTLAEELAELVQQIRVATVKRTEYKKASDTIESLSRRLARRDELKNAGLTDEELEEASQLMAELDDRFNVASSDVEKALNLEEVLRNEL